TLRIIRPARREQIVADALAVDAQLRMPQAADECDGAGDWLVDRKTMPKDRHWPGLVVRSAIGNPLRAPIRIVEQRHRPACLVRPTRTFVALIPDAHLPLHALSRAKRWPGVSHLARLC